MITDSVPGWLVDLLASRGTHLRWFWCWQGVELMGTPVCVCIPVCFNCSPAVAACSLSPASFTQILFARQRQHRTAVQDQRAAPEKRVQPLTLTKAEPKSFAQAISQPFTQALPQPQSRPLNSNCAVKSVQPVNNRYQDVFQQPTVCVLAQSAVQHVHRQIWCRGELPCAVLCA